jgi:hypothetical protein
MDDDNFEIDFDEIIDDWDSLQDMFDFFSDEYGIDIYYSPMGGE